VPAPIPPPVPGPTPPPSGIVATENVQYVAAVKAALEAQGVSLAGGCGGFGVAAKVAYGLRFVGYGLLEKASGNMCQGYATDVIVCPNRIDIVDILSDSGGHKIPRRRGKPQGGAADRGR